MTQTIVDGGFWLSLICTSLSLIGCCYAVFATLCIRRFVRRPVAPSGTYPPVTILKPLYGNEVRLTDNLRSFLEQDYPAAFEIIFGVQSEADPAIEIVNRLIAENPERDIRLVVDGSMHGSNRKISNLINMSAVMSGEVVVLADSDMRVEPDYLRKVLDALSEPGVGLVTCLYRGESAVGLWSRLSAMGIEYHFVPGVIVGLATKLAKPCFGSTIAMSADTLRAIGGFESFANQLADDYAIGRAVLRLGRRVAIPTFMVAHVCRERSWTDLFRHELRWARTNSIVDPLGYLGSGVTHALPLAVVAAALRGFDPFGLWLMAGALAARLLVQIEVVRGFRLAYTPLLLTPLRDIMSFAVYVGCFMTSKVDWRGQSFSVAADGTLVPIASAGTKKSI